jgi:hypothetical protein
MKQNSCPVVGEVSKTTGVGFDELDGAVETFSTRIADFVLTEVEQTGLMALLSASDGNCAKYDIGRVYVGVDKKLRQADPINAPSHI